MHSFVRPSLTLACAAAALSAQTRMLSVVGTHPTGRFGSTVAAIGDVDRDGFGDLITSAPTADLNGAGAGFATVLSGRTGAALYSFTGRSPEQGFGGGVGAVGDIDLDGHDDFAVGAPADSAAGTRAGRVYVISGRTGRTVFDLLGEGPGDLFGHSIAHAGDIDRDGVTDFIVGAPENGDPVPNYGPGYAKVYSGRTGTVLHRFGGRSLMFEQGHAVAGVGDVNGDGYLDVAVAAPLDDATFNRVGAARVYSGRDGSVLHVFRGEPTSDHFGASVAGVGDVDGDGRPDIGVGAPEMGTGRPGNVSIFSGRTGTRIRFVAAAAHPEMFGVSMCAAGDLDRDGFADFAVGAPGAFGMRGAAYVFRGRDGTLLRTIVGEQPGSMFSFPVRSGDLNRDGYADLIIGARGSDQMLGSVHVYSGVNVTEYGQGCGDFGAPPRLSSDTPRIGANWSLLAQGGVPAAPAVLALSAVPGRANALTATCTIYLDASTALAAASLLLDNSGAALRQLAVPNQTALLGQSLAAQLIAAGRTAPLTLSNGLYATFE